jgi:hypothetical protein
LPFSSAMGGACSVHVQAQNKPSRGWFCLSTKETGGQTAGFF